MNSGHMGLADLFDDTKKDEVRRLRQEVADLGHNLKRVMDHLGIAYERNPLLEISPGVLKELQQGNDEAAVAAVAQERGIDQAAAADFLRAIKPRLGLGDLTI